MSGLKSRKGSDNNFVLDPNKINFKSLRQYLSKVPDPRGRQGNRYRFLPLLTFGVAASLSGYTQYQQMSDWIASLPVDLRISAGLRADMTPSASALQKIFCRIDSEILENTLSSWVLKEYGNLLGKAISLDGKHIKATCNKASSQKKYLNVLVQGLGIVVKQYPTKGGHGECVAARKAIRDLPLKGTVVTADAIHTEQATASLIQKKRASLSSQ